VTDVNAPASTTLDDADSAVLSDVLIRRLQATPRHLQYIFPFSNSQLHLRYALSGIKSSSPGSMSTLTKPEFISTTQPPSDGATSNASITSSTNSLGFGLGMKLNQLTSTRAQSRWTNIISPSKLLKSVRLLESYNPVLFTIQTTQSIRMSIMHEIPKLVLSEVWVRVRCAL
jgi:hypothetical protein